MCVEHSREPVDYHPSEDFDAGEGDVETQGRIFANKAYALNN